MGLGIAIALHHAATGLAGANVKQQEGGAGGMVQLKGRAGVQRRERPRSQWVWQAIQLTGQYSKGPAGAAEQASPDLHVWAVQVRVCA